MSPPSKEYLPPKLGDDYSGHPAASEGRHHSKEEYLHPPSKSYLPPTLTDGYVPTKDHGHQGSKYEKEEHMSPPSKEYLPPTLADGYQPAKHHEKPHHASIQPPSKAYLPPTLSDGYSPTHDSPVGVTIKSIPSDDFGSSGGHTVHAATSCLTW